jgi:hypothetical protein
MASLTIRNVDDSFKANLRLVAARRGLLMVEDIGFLFVGRGSDAQRLRKDAKTRGLDNVVFQTRSSLRKSPAYIANAMSASLH